MSALLNTLSREYLWEPVDFFMSDRFTLAQLTPQFAFMLTDDAKPGPTDWVEGTWAPGAQLPKVMARILIGPNGGHELAQNLYYVWCRVTGATEQPVRKVGTLNIT